MAITRQSGNWCTCLVSAKKLDGSAHCPGLTCYRKCNNVNTLTSIAIIPITIYSSMCNNVWVTIHVNRTEGKLENIATMLKTMTRWWNETEERSMQANWIYRWYRMHLRSTTELDRCRWAARTIRICQQLINRNSNGDDTHWVWVHLQNNSQRTVRK